MAEEQVLQGLPPESTAVFESSGASIILPSQRPLHPRAMFAALLAILAATAGMYVGMDYLDGDSGMYTHRQLIFTQSVGAPNESAILTGVLVDSDGTPLSNYTLEGHLAYRRNVQANTSENGSFRMEGLDPGQMTLDIASPEGDRFTNLVLLNAPAAFEPIGFTHLVFKWPSEAEFENGEELSLGGNWIDLSESQRENSTQPYDQTAAAMYDMFGTGFIGLGIITMIIAAIGVKNKNTGLIRTATVTGFFSMGHFYLSCG
ncbi:MAG: carboxypeptidase-like regulatory domain-containing protein, partial [Candidatus Thermoplasmatota archaeon]|nr:carboxypeptidase-like regulatory domain-containing protein [Candidatus Thermoplasmatota archaeon]